MINTQLVKTSAVNLFKSYRADNMGPCPSRFGHRNRENGAQNEQIISSDEVTVDSQNKYDDEVLEVLRRELRENPDIFLLNNILMSVMFFEYYEKEISKIGNGTTKHEKELNLKLINQESKQCIMPDAVFDAVDKHIKFRPLHGPKKNVSQNLVPQRLYVVHDNIEVLEPEDTGDYSGIDKPNYRVRMDESTKAGFVKLQQIEKLNVQGSGSNSNYTTRTPSSTSSFEEKLTNGFHNNSERANSGVFDGPSTSNGIRSTDSSDSYDYVTITNTKTPQPIHIDMKKLTRVSNSLSNKCFTTVMVKNLHLSENDPDDEEDNDTEPPPVLFHPVTYIDSHGFMEHFKNNVFPNSLSQALGLDMETVKSATAIPGLIFCDSYDNDNVTQRHIIPSVSIQWPAALAFEWAIREDRPTIIDPKTAFRYKWPTDGMIQEIKRLHCVVVPKGCILKRGENKESNLEWEVAFPKAEKFIETKMSHAQMRSYLFLLALHKTFIEPITTNHGLLPEHIRTHMYWECEANYRNWPENRLGTKLMLVLKNLYDKLGKRRMSDYFIRGKNVFENIPGKYLLPAQKLIFEIRESPVMFFIVALRNLRYTSGRFYPTLDFKELLDILINDGVKSTNFMIYTLKEERPKVHKKRVVDNAEMEWTRRYHEEVKKKKKKEEQKEKEEHANIHRKSVDSVDFKWCVEKEQDIMKTRSILLFFITHFIEMADKSLKLATTNQSLLYLKQAWYLTKLLEDTSSFRPDAQEYQQKIRDLEDTVRRKAALGTSAPIVPKRSSFHYIGGEAVQQVKRNQVHLQNLTRSYNSGLNSDPVQKKIKQVQSNRKVVVDVHEDTKSPTKSGEKRRTIVFNPDVQTNNV